MKKAKISHERDVAVDRIQELEAAIVRLHDERGSDLADLAVSDATIDAARARIGALERTCENLTQRIAMAERERDVRLSEVDRRTVAREAALRDELASVREQLEQRLSNSERDRLRAELQEARITLATFERDRERLEERAADFETQLQASEFARVELADAYAKTAEKLRELEALTVSYASERAGVAEKIRELETRNVSLEHARERLFAGSVRLGETRAALESLSADRLKDIERLQVDRAELSDRFGTERAEHEDVVSRIEARRAKLQYELEGALLQLAKMKADSDRFETRALSAEEELERRKSALDDTSEIIRALSLAHHRAVESVASLELVRLRLEYDVATRVGAAELQASRAAIAANRLREDRTLLLETIALRERRVAMLESTIRDIATDLIRAAEAERTRYLEMHATLLSSKIVKARNVIARIMRRPLALRARFAAARAIAKRRMPRSADKRPRHLRSA